MTIGKYKILRELGRGGMGVVYLGQHELLGSPVAIKVLLKQACARESAVKRFFAEAKAATSIQDPGIVRVLDYGYQEDGSAYIVLEFLDGESLSARIKRLGRLPEADALRICRQLAGSLAAVHDAGIIHRDLKPDNIILVSDPLVEGGERPKILDFGIAKLTRDPDAAGITTTGAVIGTLMYMAPEQWRAAKLVDARSDIYSLGCMLYRLLTGTTPVAGATIGELCSAHLLDVPEPPSALTPVSAGVDGLLLSCLAKHPDERLPSMHELARRIADIEARRGTAGAARQPAEGRARSLLALGRTSPPRRVSAVEAKGESTTLSAAAAPLPPPAAKSVRRHGWLAGGVAAAAALMLGVIGAAVARTGGKHTAASELVSQPASAGARTLAQAISVRLSRKARQGAEPGEVAIRITSSPPGASVRWTGAEGRKVTPFVYRAPRGTTPVTFGVTLPGYQGKSVTVSEANNDSLHVILHPLSGQTRQPPPPPDPVRALYDR